MLHKSVWMKFNVLIKIMSNYAYMKSTWTRKKQMILHFDFSCIRLFIHLSAKNISRSLGQGNISALKIVEDSFSRKCEADSGHITYLNDLWLWFFGMQKGKPSHWKLFPASLNSVFKKIILLFLEFQRQFFSSRKCKPFLSDRCTTICET